MALYPPWILALTHNKEFIRMQKKLTNVVQFASPVASQNKTPPQKKNSIRFTESAIKKLVSKSRRIVFWCNGLAGFGIRVSPKGNKSWVYEYRLEGVHRMLTLGKYPRLSLIEARKAFVIASEKVQLGIDPATEHLEKKKAEQQAMTIKQLVPLYIEYCKSRGEKRWDEKQRVLNKELVAVIGARKVKDISFRDMANMIYEIGIKRSKATQATRFLSHTKGLFKYAKNFHGLVEFNPCADLEAPKVKKTTKRSLNTREVFAVWHNLNKMKVVPVIILGLKFMLCTMTRGIEVRTAEWSEIDLEGKVWVIPDHKAKNGRRHLVPLNSYALDILEEVKEWTDGHRYVFGWNRINNIDKSRETSENDYLKETAFNHAMRVNFDQIGIDQKFTPHDLRRTGATLLTSVGYSTDWVSKLLNHTPSGVTETHYDMFDYFEEKRAGIECIKYILDRILSSKNIDFVPSIKTLRSEFMAKGLVFEFLKEEYYLSKTIQHNSVCPSNPSSHATYTLSYDLEKL
ncbi:tyrosine-type recombinase/integrase [Roseivirga sp. 4D4]|uniref:tyrosine-type recombinase/integrase n=1 Tax=Roseivirga sp. 4D4 TaxID=1889784 RepID=UPI0009F6F0D2|nr:site-specific integrase [Roseivirga sp. 4D4]